LLRGIRFPPRRSGRWVLTQRSTRKRSKPMPDPIFTLQQGSLPLLISIPHMGTRLDPDIAANFTQVAGFMDDTDWHLDRLYRFARDGGASFLTPEYSRYVIDL